MSYRIDGSAVLPYCLQCKKPMWNHWRAKIHSNKKGHRITSRRVRRGEFPKKGSNAGEKNGRHQLTWAVIQKIKDLYRHGWSTYQIAKIYAVSQAAIWYVIAGRSWICKRIVKES